MPRYYSIIFTPSTWARFQKLEPKKIAFRETLLLSVKKIQAGDVLVCYLAKRGTWCAALEVQGAGERSAKSLYPEDPNLTIAMRVHPLVLLEADAQLDVKSAQLWDALDRFKRVDASAQGWAVKTGLLRSLRPLSDNDGALLVKALMVAAKSSQFGERPAQCANQAESTAVK